MTEREAMFIHDCFVNGFYNMCDDKFAFKYYSSILDKALESNILKL